MVLSDCEYIKLGYRKNKVDATHVAAENIFLLKLGKITLIPD